MNLHLVSFNVPFPPDYGGVMDVFYKLKALYSMGVKVHLHAYAYGRGAAHQLNDVCARVSYYPRPLGFTKNLSSLPFIVKTRSSKALLEVLRKDNDPILLEGLHCTYPLYAGVLSGRRTIVRTHNIEHEYYDGLAASEPNPIRKAYFHIESYKLKRYEKVLTLAHGVAAISPNDLNHFSTINQQTVLVTPFHPFEAVDVRVGKGEYVLMHGDLSVPENILSVEWILRNVAGVSPYPFVIAGRNPTGSTVALAAQYPNVEIVANPNDQHLSELINGAHINLIHSQFPQGFKLKLLHSLYRGRYCICSPSVVKNTGLSELCSLATSADDYTSLIGMLMPVDFDTEQVSQREKLLLNFSNALQTKKIVESFQV